MCLVNPFFLRVPQFIPSLTSPTSGATGSNGRSLKLLPTLSFRLNSTWVKCPIGINPAVPGTCEPVKENWAKPQGDVCVPAKFEASCP